MLIFDDESRTTGTAQKVLEKLSQVTLPTGLQPQIGADYSPVGQIYFFTLQSTNPDYDVMELKSLRGLGARETVEVGAGRGRRRRLRRATREYQVRVDPNKLIAYGLNIGQVEQQLANNNINAGGSFIEAGEQADQRARGGTGEDGRRHRAIRCSRRKNGTPIRVRDIATVEQGPKIRLGQFGKAIHRIGRQIHRQRRCGGRHRAAAQRARMPIRRSRRSTRKSIS